MNKMKKEALPFVMDRIREIPQSFSWIDRRIINDKILPQMLREEISLYFFLVLVSNRYGVSFYGTKKICHFTGLTPDEFELARCGLEELDLIAYRAPLYQVLSLPPGLTTGREKPVGIDYGRVL